MSFSKRHINRIKFPVKHILVCEDDIQCQTEILQHFNTLFERQGSVTISCVSGGMEAANLIGIEDYINLIILDHDMPWGNGADLLNYMSERKIKIPIITFSGLPQNNTILHQLGADYVHTKQEVVNGEADQLIKAILHV